MLLRKKLAVVLAGTLMLALSSGPTAFAAANPSGMGQPNQEISARRGCSYNYQEATADGSDHGMVTA